MNPTDLNRRQAARVLGAAALAGVSALVTPKSAFASPKWVGRKAPALETILTSGTAWKLSDQKARVVLVDFWATWCAPCKQSFPFYEALIKKYSGTVTLLALSVDEKESPIAPFVKAAGVTFPVAWDRGQRWAETFSPDAMPTLFLLDEQRTVRHIHSGFRKSDEESLSTAIARLLRP